MNNEHKWPNQMRTQAFWVEWRNDKNGQNVIQMSWICLDCVTNRHIDCSRHKTVSFICLFWRLFSKSTICFGEVNGEIKVSLFILRLYPASSIAVFIWIDHIIWGRCAVKSKMMAIKWRTWVLFHSFIYRFIPKSSWFSTHELRFSLLLHCIDISRKDACNKFGNELSRVM